MDSRVRGNDGVKPHILRKKLSLKFPQNDREKYIPFPRTRRNSAKNRRHSRESGNPFGAINFGIFREFSAKIKFRIPAHFFCKNEVNAGNLSVKMDSRFRGNDEVNAATFYAKIIKFEIPAKRR